MEIKRTVYSLLLILVVTVVSITAQNKPYTVGESLEYEGTYSKLVLRGIDVALLSFNVEKDEKTDNLLIKTEAISNGGIVKLFNFKFYQKFESLINGSTFEILKTVKRDEQGDRVRDSEAVFDYKSGKVTYVETDPKDMARPPHKVASTIEKNVQDLTSGVYQLRYLPFEVGKTLELTVSDGGLVYKVPILVTARERKKSILGKKWCFRVEPQVFGENRMIDREGDMTIWITDDKSRIPIRSVINTGIGKVVVKLKKLSYGKAGKPKAR